MKNTDAHIPHIIHYCWFGGAKPALVMRCIESWKLHMPNYKIHEWNESNVDINSHPFLLRMQKEKKYAFMADYARLLALRDFGGVYLDTDMEIVKPLDDLLHTELLLGEEEDGIISAGMIACIAHHTFIDDVLKYYDSHANDSLITIPRVLSAVYSKHKSNNPLHLLVMPPVAFYPYSQTAIKNYHKSKLTSDTYGVHLWNYSWGNPIMRKLNHYKTYKNFIRILDKLGIKQTLKKIFGIA